MIPGRKHNQKWALTRLVGRVQRLKRMALVGAPKVLIFGELALIQKALADCMMYFHLANYPEESVTFEDWEKMDDPS